MLTRHIRHIVVGCLIVSVSNATFFPSTLWSSSSQENARAIKEVKEKISKRGVGEKARVKVRLHDKTEIQGYVSQAGEVDFVVRDKTTGMDRTIGYEDVRSVKGPRSAGARIAIWAGVGAGVVVAVYYLLIVKVTVSN